MLSSSAVATCVNPGVAPPSPEIEAAQEIVVLDTRFGAMELTRSHVVRFPSGLLGFTSAQEFALVELDNPKYRMFRILQCVTDATLSFIVFPPNPDSGLIDAEDIDAACAALRFSPKDLVVLLLVTVRKADTGHQLSVNLRAPVMIDSSRFVGAQYVLSNERYPVRFPL